MFILSLNLFIIYGSSILTGWVIEAIIPYLINKLEYSGYSRKVAAVGVALSRPEKEYILDNYDTIQENVYNYIKITILFGYTAMFISALPLAATLAYISQLFEIQCDSWKLLEVYRRPDHHDASSIGTWQTIFFLMATICVVTNSAIVAFTMDILDGSTIVVRYWVFVVFQWTCFTLQAVIMAMIPDIPEEINFQIQRTQHIRAKIIDMVPDEVFQREV